MQNQDGAAKSAAAGKPPYWALTAAGVFCLLFILAVVGVYYHKLGGPELSSDPGSWGQFGDYLGGLINPFFALLNLATVIFIAIKVSDFQYQQRAEFERTIEQDRLVFDLFHEWNAQQMYRTRIGAWDLVGSHRDIDLQGIDERLLDKDTAVQIWVVVGFFSRLGILAQQKKAGRDMVVKLFGEIFYCWWLGCFKRQLVPCDIDSKDQIVEFKHWLDRNVALADRVKWAQRARRSINQRWTQRKRERSIVAAVLPAANPLSQTESA